MGRRTLLLIASILVAALGTSLIWLYVQGADTRATAATTTEVQVLVAQTTVAAGRPAGEVKTQPRMVPQTLVDGLGDSLVSNASDLTGYTRTDVVAGLPLLKTQFVGKAPAASSTLQGQRPDQVAIQVTLPDPQRLVGLLQPGSRIRVYTTFVDLKDKTKKWGGVLFNDVTVLLSGPAAAGTTPTATTANGRPPVPEAIVTLALTNEQAKKLVFAENSGSGDAALWFGLLGSRVVPDDKKIVSGLVSGDDS